MQLTKNIMYNESIKQNVENNNSMEYKIYIHK